MSTGLTEMAEMGERRVAAGTGGSVEGHEGEMNSREMR